MHNQPPSTQNTQNQKSFCELCEFRGYFEMFYGSE
jgi:hypothetical protein